MIRLFISHCSDDEKNVKMLIDSIEKLRPQKEYNIFYSSAPQTGVAVGEDIIKRISTEVSTCDYFIAFITESYVRSIHCLYELSIARFNNRVVVPIVLSKVANTSITEIVGTSIRYIYVGTNEWKKDLQCQLNNIFHFENNCNENAIFNFVDIDAKRPYIGSQDIYQDTYKYFRANGIKKFSNDLMSQQDLIERIRGAKTLKILSTTGYHLLERIKDELVQILVSQGDIYFLLPNRHSNFCEDVAEVEKPLEFEKNSDRIAGEFVNAISELKDAIAKAKNKKSNIGRVYVGCSHTLLRQTITLVDGYVNDENKGWALVSLTIPPNITRAKTPSMQIDLRNKNEKIIEKDGVEVNNIFQIFNEHFDSIFNFARKNMNALELTADDVFDAKTGFFLEQKTALKYWKGLMSKAQENIENAQFNSEKILLEVAAQHPLRDGCKPNVEFAQRLNKAIEFYNNNKDNDVYFYIPGSVHNDDKIPLSEAGEKYLIENGIPQTRIFANDSNIKYKGNDGVYNSADECYVASRIFFDNKFTRLISVCSVYQALKKNLFYIANGIINECLPVSPLKMFHQSISEAIFTIPYTIYEDATWQGEDSILAKKSREERKPN